MQNHHPHDQKIDPQNDLKMLLIHPVGVDTMQNHHPHDQKTDPQNDLKMLLIHPVVIDTKEIHHFFQIDANHLR